jgi:hypothetical protein
MGAGLQKISELLTVVFTNGGDKDNPNQSYYKVSSVMSINGQSIIIKNLQLRVTFEVAKLTKKTWLDVKSDKFQKGRILNYWCFSPSLG